MSSNLPYYIFADAKILQWTHKKYIFLFWSKIKLINKVKVIFTKQITNSLITN